MGSLFLITDIYKHDRIVNMDFEQLPGQVLDFILFFLPFAVFYFLIVFIYKTWVDFAQTRFDTKQKKILLRIYPPKIVTKTPAAMELFLNAIYQTGGEANWYDKKVLGKQRAVFSLEMASHGGEVAFYIRTKAGLRREVETKSMRSILELKLWSHQIILKKLILMIILFLVSNGN